MATEYIGPQAEDAPFARLGSAANVPFMCKPGKDITASAAMTTCVCSLHNATKDGVLSHQHSYTAHFFWRYDGPASFYLQAHAICMQVDIMF
jgi:hypothetical protein